MLPSPNDYDLANEIGNNVVGSTLFTRRDIRIVNIIHGPDIVGMKEKTTTTKTSKILDPNEVKDIPSHIVKNYL